MEQITGTGIEHRTAAAKTAYGCGAMALDCFTQLCGNLVEGCFKVDWRERTVWLALQRFKNTVLSIQGSRCLQAFEAGVALGHQVILVAYNLGDALVIIQRQCHTATGGAETAKGFHFTVGHGTSTFYCVSRVSQRAAAQSTANCP